MGGVGIRITEKFHPHQDKTWDVDGETLFLSDSTVETLVERDPHAALALMPSKEEIASKSKADGFAKALVCMQALWFLAQCLTRRKCLIPSNVNP